MKSESKIKLLCLLVLLFVLLTGCVSNDFSSNNSQLNNNSNLQVQSQSNNVNVNSNLSNDNYYINTAGNKVHSPAYSNTVPAGASARCIDGSYSFSQSRRGTCSHHGGVAEWL